MNILTSNVDVTSVLLPIGLILILSKLFSIVCKKIGLPSVIGYLVSGLLVGLLALIPENDYINILSDSTKEGLDFLAKIGVILIMFSAGLETNVKQIKETGIASIIITLGGVIVPLLFGTLLSFGFSFIPGIELAGAGKENTILTYLFYGTILSATSVSITVAVLKELNKLDTKVGSAIISAAIIDDVLGIVLMSLVISLDPSGNAEGEGPLPFGLTTGNNVGDIFILIFLMIAFFVIALIFGKLIKKLFAYLDVKWPGHRRIPIFGLAFCFIYSYIAEKCFGVADITGAYVAGIVLSESKTRNYINKEAEHETNYLFGPIFFANIGIGMYEGLSLNNIYYIIFGICFIVVGLLGKVIGCGLGALISKFNKKDALRVGIGMMARAEVVIVTAKKGIDVGLVSANIMPFVLFIIIITSFLTPIFLKVLYKNELEETLPSR